MPRIDPPFVGWRGRRFYFVHDTISVRLEGPSKAVISELRKLLPAWRQVAVQGGETELVTMLDREIAALPPEDDNG